MEINEFIENLTELFEDANPDTIKPEARLRDIEGYSSLIALSIIAMVDEKYDVKLKGDDIRRSDTIEDLFNIVKVKSKI
ncbi:MAG: acyl carrier protein [Bacteroidales bacterium]|nr:acyl carrier protein [Bacteroidales bacterium]